MLKTILINYHGKRGYGLNYPTKAPSFIILKTKKNMKTITKQVPNKCPVCNGRGYNIKYPPIGQTTSFLDKALCHACDGDGIIWSEEKTIIEDEIKEHKCPLC